MLLLFYSVNRVHTGPGNPGKSWNFTLAFSRTGKKVTYTLFPPSSSFVLNFYV